LQGGRSRIRPVAKPTNWAEIVDEPQTEPELAAIQRCVRRGAPFGGDVWQQRSAMRLGLESTMKPVGRPGKDQETTEK
jgi:REP-associated tyrosine transposase